MNLSNIDELKNLLHSKGLKPNDYLGQNFLVDENALRAIIEAADLQATDTVLEVGPGLGVLTNELVKKAGKVIAVEKDTRLFEILKKTFAIPTEGRDPSRKGFLAPLEMVNQDILRFNLKKNIQSDYKVVANIPYYLTSKLFQLFLENEHPPKLLVLMIQKEVGERVVAEPGELSVLGISVQIFADAEIAAVKIPARRPQSIPDLSANKNKSYGQDPGSNQGGVRDGFGEKKIPLIIPKTSFWPVPKVDSVILKIVPRNKYPEISDQKLFFRIVKMAFAGKRKQIKNSLSAYSLELIEKAGINPMMRPQELSIEQWIGLYKRIAGSVERGDDRK